MCAHDVLQVFEQEMQLGPAAALETLQQQLVSHACKARHPNSADHLLLCQPAIR